MLRWVRVLCLIALQKQIHAAIMMQPNERQLLSDSEVEEMLRKYPELNDKFDSMELEYRRYIQEVSLVLLTDPGMREKLDSADNVDLSFGEIAEELHKLDPKLRSRLNELKRAEVDRLLDNYRKYVKATGKELDNITHVDTNNLDTFEVKDLRYLIKATVSHLNTIDEMRRQAFKEHEMKKRFDEEEKLRSISDEERSRYLAEQAGWAKIHREREKQVLHPGSNHQFKDVWENLDQMKDQPFSPITFFRLHDLHADGVWDENELKALFYREMMKLFKEDDLDFDLAEKEEESELMREHYFQEADINKDRLITLDEFMDHFKNMGFLLKDWNPHDGQSMFTKEEYDSFSKIQNQLKKIQPEKRTIKHIDM